MLAAFLVVLAFAGGGAIVYAVMEGPRRKAVQELVRLRTWDAGLSDQASRQQAAARELSAREEALAAAVAAHDRRVKNYETNCAAFEKQVIRYDELATENRILKADLKNLHVSLAHQAFTQTTAGQAAAVIVGQRDQLGRLYFEEARAAALKAVTAGNHPAVKKRLLTAVERARAAGAELPAAEVAAAVAELAAQYQKAVRAAVEREHQAELRERMREEARREKEVREVQEAAEQAERERMQIAAALEEARRRALADAAGQHAAEVEALKAKLAEAEAKSRRAISLAELVKHGYVYVISNRGAFGPDVFKIGMTRRLEPQDRVDELSGAAVPFPFDVHLMIGCDDAPKLEKALHHRFHTRRVNRVNPRKEFFRVTVAEVVAAVRELHGEVEYKADMEALEFMQSQTMTDADLAEVERAFEAAEDVTDT